MFRSPPISSAPVVLFLASVLATSACLRPSETATNPRGLDALAPEDSVSPTTLPMATFIVNGQPFCFAGTNNYYLSYKSHRMTDEVLESATHMGLRVIRIWANIDRGSLDAGVRSVDGGGDKDGVYFQYWDPAAKWPAYNDGSSGLERLDYVLQKASTLGLKVVLVLTNNWKEFGGMDQYVVWFGLKQHHAFYTDPSARQAFKAWAAHLARRRNSLSGILYRDDPTIFGWELANEPRCSNGGDFDDPQTCTVQTVVAWADEMSSAIKAFDPNHLVSVGDEGFFAGGVGWGYDGADGIDHNALLALSHVDFGTFHLYPDTWGQSSRWSLQWIEDHIAAARRAGKPTVLEEYGEFADRNDHGDVVDPEHRARTLARWHEALRKRGGNAALFWMFAGHDDSNRVYPDYDRFTVYAKDGVAPLLHSFASRMATDAQACVLYRSLVPADSIAKSPFVTTAPPPTRIGAAMPRRAGDRS